MKSWIFVIRTFPPFLIPAQRHTPSFSANSPCVPSVKSCVLSNCAFHEKVLFRHLYCVKNEGILLTIFCNFSLPALISRYAELAGQLAAAKEELQPMKDIRYWVSKALTPEQSEALKKPEPKHSVTEKMKFLQEQSSNQQEQKNPQQKKQNREQ